MIRTEQLAEAALAGDALELRGMAQDWLRENTSIANCAIPASTDRTVLAIAAGLVELFAERRGEAPPAWTRSIGAVDHPVYLVKSAERMRRFRHLCETESPPSLRRRNLFAPPTFLEFA